MGAVKQIKKIVRPKRYKRDEQAAQQPQIIYVQVPSENPQENFHCELSKHIEKNG